MNWKIREDTLKYYCFASMAFMIVFPLKPAIYTITLTSSVLILMAKKKDWLNALRWHYEYLLAIYFLVILCSAIFSQDHTRFSSAIERQIIFVLFPVLFVLNKETFKKEQIFRVVLRAFVAGVIAASILCLAVACYRSITLQGNEIVFVPSVKEYRGFFESTVYGGNYFFSSDFSIFMHPTYFSVYTLFAACIIFYRLQAGTVSKWLGYSSLVWLLCVLFLLSSRAVMFTAVILFFVLFAQALLRGNVNRKLGVGFSIAGVIFIGFLFLNPRVNLLSENAGNNRLQIWKAGTEVVIRQWILGYGMLDVESEVLNQYQVNGFEEGVHERYNLHNQYLEVLAQSGVIGLLSLLSIFYSLVRLKRDFLTISFVLILAVNMMAESMLNVFSGIVFFVFMSCLFLAVRDKTKFKTIIESHVV